MGAAKRRRGQDHETKSRCPGPKPPPKVCCKRCCYHLMDGYLHGRDVPPDQVKEECCRCGATHVIPREQCAEIRRRERDRTQETKSVMWQLDEPCRRVRVRWAAGRLVADADWSGLPSALRMPGAGSVGARRSSTQRVWTA